MRLIGQLNGLHVVVGRGWVPAKRRSSDGPQMKQTERTSERGSARAMALGGKGVRVRVAA